MMLAGGMSVDVTLNNVCDEGVKQTPGMKLMKSGVISLIDPSLAGKTAMSMYSMVCSKLFYRFLYYFLIIMNILT